MSSKKPEDAKENRRKRRRTIHLPSVNPNCYLSARCLHLGEYEDCVIELSIRDDWKNLRQILQPVADLVVKDALGQYFVENVRCRFDSAVLADDGWECPFVHNVMWQLRIGEVDVLKMLLAVGLDVDRPDKFRQLRPSHLCGALSRADFAELIFSCRPSMKAVTNTGWTPLQAASDGSKYKGDKKHPQRRLLRKNVKSYIETATAPSDRFDETVKQMAALAEKFIDKEDEASVLSSKVMKLDTQVEQLKNEAVAKDAKIEELSEAVSVYRTRLEEAGIGFESNNVNSRKSASEASVVGASSSSDC